VLEGSIIVHLEFYTPLLLQAGDHIYIDSRMGHAYLAGSERTCRMITVCAGAPSDAIQRAVLERPAAGARPIRARAKGNPAGTPDEGQRRKPAKTRK
jgi:hypothetical protein